MFRLEDFLKEGVFLTDPSGKIHMGWGGMTYCASPLLAQACFFIPDFFLKTKKPWLVTRNFMSLNRDLFKKDFKKFKANHLEADFDYKWDLPDKINFETQFKNILRDLNNNKRQKAVPVVFEKTFKKPSKEQLLKIISLVLQKSSDKQFAYGYWNQNEGIIGLTPEYLFTGHQDNFKTMALAGTRTSNQKSLLLDKKELTEHNFVISDIKEKLNLAGIKLENFKTYEESYSSLFHLKTPITFKNKLSYTSLVRTLHPTSALGTYPVDHEFSWLLEQPEAKTRNRYGAPFGFQHQDNKICLVAIRNIQWNQKETLLASGCGVVKQSVLEKEWLELGDKRSSVKSNLGLV